MASHVSVLEQTQKEILNFLHTQDPYELEGRIILSLDKMNSQMFQILNNNPDIYKKLFY